MLPVDLLESIRCDGHTFGKGRGLHDADMSRNLAVSYAERYIREHRSSNICVVMSDTISDSFGRAFVEALSECIVGRDISVLCTWSAIISDQGIEISHIYKQYFDGAPDSATECLILDVAGENLNTILANLLRGVSILGPSGVTLLSSCPDKKRECDVRSHLPPEFDMQVLFIQSEAYYGSPMPNDDRSLLGVGCASANAAIPEFIRQRRNLKFGKSSKLECSNG